jgi:mRNA interferase RelE/StbE
MGYRVELEPRAVRGFETISSRDRRRVAERLKSLEVKPRPAGCRKLKAIPGLRLSVGDYRILYTVNDENHTVTVWRIGHRRDVYR